MNRQIWKPVLAGLLIGGALYFIPFFVARVVVFVLIVGLIIRLFAGRRPGRFGQYYRAQRLQFADNIRNMSDEEYARFKEQATNYGCGRHNSINQKNDQHEK